MKKNRLPLNELTVKSFIIPLDQTNVLKGRAKDQSDAPIPIPSGTTATEGLDCTSLHLCNDATQELCLGY